MAAYVSITCEAEECTVEDSPLGFPRTATEARARLHRQGWHRTRDGRDICPDCWEAGRR